MLTLFRSNQAYAGILLFGYALLLQLPFFVWGGGAQVPGEVEGAASKWIFEWFGEARGGARLAILIIPILLVGIQGILASGLSADHRMARRVTQFPGVGVVLAWALVPAAHLVNPFGFANLFFLLAIGANMSVYQRQETGVAQFNVGAWLGLAVLFVPNYLLFLPAFWMGTSILRTLNLRVILQTLTGLMLVLFLAGTYAYLREDFGEFWALQWRGFGLIRLLEADDWHSAIPLGGLVLLCLLTNGLVKSLLNIEGSKNVQFTAWLLLFSAVVAGFGGPASTLDLQLLQVPVGMLFGLWLVRLDDGRAEVVHLLVLAAALGLSVRALVGLA